MPNLSLKRSSHSTAPSSTASTTLAVTTRAAELLQVVGECGPLSPLKTVSGLALIIIDTVQSIDKLKEDNEALASRAAELAVAICAECAANENLTLEQQFKCDQLLKTLGEVQSFVQAQVELGRLKRFLKMRELRDSLVILDKKLDDCCRLFSITSLQEIQRLISSEAIINQSTLNKLVLTINSDINRVATNVKDTYRGVQTGLDNLATRFDLVIGNSGLGASQSVSDDGFRILRQDQVKLRCPVRTLSNAFIHRGEFRGEKGLTKAIVKTYISNKHGEKEFQEDLKFWKTYFHPNLHQLLGHSSMRAPGPFILFSDYASRDVNGYMQKKLESNEAVSFTSTARLLHGVASGMEYLRRIGSLSKTELQECIKPFNLVLTAEGEVVIGHNLVANKPGQNLDPLPVNLEEFLLELFWSFGVRFTYGPQDPDLSDWNWILARNGGKSYSHMRMLECFMLFISGSFGQVAEDLDNLMDALEALAARDELTFRNIRRAVLEVRDGIGFWYRPPKPLGCRLLDVGYIRDGEFIRLDNCRSMAPFLPDVRPEPVFYTENNRDIDWVDEFGVSHYPAVPTLAIIRRDNSSVVYENVSKKLFKGTPEALLPPHLARARDYTVTREDGLIRHRFTRSTSARIKCLTNCERVQDLNACWTTLIENVEKVYKAHKASHADLNIGDLILVTKIDNDTRVSTYDWKPQDGCSVPPSYIEFVEYEKTDVKYPWGYWVLDGDDCGVTITENRYPQSIGFIQLDTCDIIHTSATVH